MMCAVVDCIELCVFELSFELIVDLNDHILGKITTRNTRLIGNQNRQPVIVIENPDRFR
jgi:hypothetical protein